MESVLGQAGGLVLAVCCRSLCIQHSAACRWAAPVQHSVCSSSCHACVYRDLRPLRSMLPFQQWVPCGRVGHSSDHLGCPSNVELQSCLPAVTGQGRADVQCVSEICIWVMICESDDVCAHIRAVLRMRLPHFVYLGSCCSSLFGVRLPAHLFRNEVFASLWQHSVLSSETLCSHISPKFWKPS